MERVGSGSARFKTGHTTLKENLNKGQRDFFPASLRGKELDQRTPEPG
jgi:hypothetical protein